MTKYTKEEVLIWHSEYLNTDIPVVKVADTFKIKLDTMLKYFHKYDLWIRPKGFRVSNSKGRYGIDPIRSCYVYQLKFRYKKRAARKGLEVTLTEDEFITIVTSDCYYCGVSYLSETRRVNRRLIPMLTVDRMDSGKGYTKDNCVAACKQCNTMKMDIPLDKWYTKMEVIINRKKARLKCT